MAELERAFSNFPDDFPASDNSSLTDVFDVLAEWNDYLENYVPYYRDGIYKQDRDANDQDKTADTDSATPSWRVEL